MNRLTKYTAICTAFIGGYWMNATAQELPKKVTLNGTARSVFLLDEMDVKDSIPDTTSYVGQNSGHVMADLGVNIRPNDQMEIQGMLRIRNDFGGFWGSGVTFDLRQLYLKGIIANKFRYQLGDINYKMSPFTLHNSDHELHANNPEVFGQLSDMLVMYDNFYTNDNYWRQQGGAFDFTLTFKKVIKELQTNLFTTRLVTTDFGNTNDRLMSGANFTFVLGSGKSIGLNAVNTYDVVGTSRNDIAFRNPVYTGRWDLMWNVGDFRAGIKGEAGTSKSYYENSTLAPEYEDYFVTGSLVGTYEPFGLTLELGMHDVGADFYSVGAQTKRVNFGARPLAYSTITNEKVNRGIGMLDLLRDASLYNLQLSSQLGPHSVVYDNIYQYGIATPNRTGWNVGLAYEPTNELWNISVRMDDLSEIRGQGTTELRSFSRMQGDLGLNIHKMAGMDKRLILSGSFRADETNRTGGEFVNDVDFTTNAATFALTWEFLPKLDLLLGYSAVSGSGFEFISERNEFNEIVDFEEYEADQEEVMIGAGLQYRMTENAFLSVNTMQYSLENILDGMPDYDISNFSILFNIKF